MKDKTKEQLVEEIELLRKEVAELKQGEAQRKRAEKALRRIEWLLTKSVEKRSYAQPYGNLVQLNTGRELVDSVGEHVLTDIVGDYLDLLDTSSAVYEKNGDYALGIFASGWCRFLDQASRNLCGTDDNREALESGKWHCHESCWTEASKVSIETGQPVDIECRGGICLYAVPIWAGREIVGSINFGYGGPPRGPQKLREIAERYGLNVDELLEQANLYESRPHFMIDIAKRRLVTSAKLIGTMVERKRAEDELRKERDKTQKYLDVANTIIVVIDSDQKVRLINQKGCKVLGYKEEEILDKNWYDTFVPERIRDEVKAVSAKLMAGEIKPVEYFENPVLTKSGEERLIAWHNAVLKDEEGNIIATLSSGEDITERKRSEEERARLSHDLLKRVKELRCFYSVSTAIEENSSIDEFLSRVASLIPLAMQYPELARSRITVRSHKYQSKDFTESKCSVLAHIKVAGEVVGNLGICYTEERPFLKEEVDLVTGIAERIGKVVERIEVEETLQENEKRFRALIENSSDIIQVVDSEGVIRYVSPSVQRILGYRPEELIGRPSVDFVHPDDLPIVARGFKEAFEKPEVPQVTVCRCKHKDGTWRLIEGIGANQLGNPAVNGFISNMHDITERKKVEEQLEHSFIDLAETISRAIEFRDPYTAGHQRRVAELARLVGEKMGLDKNRIRGLHIGGLLHDIGKISTPESILAKPGRLSDEEWNLVCAHAKQGYEILDGSRFPWPVAEMALHHHERMDGSGYPDGISGDKISLENRILGVCDVAEAMSSFRPYRPARSMAEVLKELSSGKGTKYDPAVVDVMLEIIESGEFEIGSK